MAKSEVSIAPLRLIGAFKYKFKGQTAEKTCACIPEDCLTVDRRGDYWLSITAFDDTKFERQTHSLKQKLTKAQYEELKAKSADGKVSTPFLGTIRTEKVHVGGSAFTKEDPACVNEMGEDLPF